MVRTFQIALLGVILVGVGTIEWLMPSLTRRDLLFGVTVPPNARATPAGRGIIRGYRLALLLVLALLAIGVGLLAALAPATWWANGWPALGVIVVALAPVLAYLPANRAAHRLAAAAPQAHEPHEPPSAELAPRRYADVLPWVWEALPLALIAATASYLATMYAAAPGIIPIHFDAAGQPNAYAAKSIGSYFFGVWTQLALEILLTVLAMLTVRAKAQPGRAASRFRRVWLRYVYGIKVLVIALVGVTAVAEAQAAVSGQARVGWLLPATLGVVAIVLVSALVLGVYTGQGGARLAGGEATDRMDDRYWKLGVFYANPDDPAIFVERRYGIGWTINVGNARAVLVLLAILAGAAFAGIVPRLLLGQ